jgi:hypothetical protein
MHFAKQMQEVWTVAERDQKQSGGKIKTFNFFFGYAPTFYLNFKFYSYQQDMISILKCT